MPRQRTIPRVTVACQQCRAPFDVRVNAIERGRGKFCSIACRAAASLGSELRPAAERFWEKVECPTVGPGGHRDSAACWIWTGHIDTQQRYGRFTVQRKTWNAHQWAYLRYVGPVSSGLELDHLCRVRHCVNWNHLEPVPHLVNAMRGEAPTVVLSRLGVCARGHEASDQNVYRRRSTGRIVYCRPCRRMARQSAKAN